MVDRLKLAQITQLRYLSRFAMRIFYFIARMSAGGLSRYLMSDENLCVKSEIFEVHQDMNQPLSHYFINSSHNTYLTGELFRLRHIYIPSTII